MAQLNQPLLRKIFRFGTGVGIVVGEHHLTVYAVKVRPSGARLLGTLTIENFRDRPAAEWGDQYRKMAAARGVARAAALVVLPRYEVIFRQIQLPGVADADAAAAVRFQLDNLHPYPEDEVVHDFQRVGRSETFIVAIAERRVVDSYTVLFAEAGIPLAGLTFSGGAVFPSLRLYGAPPSDGFVAVPGLAAGVESGFEVYGESPSYRLFSAEFDMPVERAAELAAAEMRLDPATPARDLMEMLPKWQSAPDGMDFSEAGVARVALPWAAGMTAACPHLSAPVNLLPLEARTVRSRLQYVPAIALTSILALMTLALVFRGAWMDRQYAAVLNAELQRLEPRTKHAQALVRKTGEASERMQALDDYRKRTKSQLDLVLELTQMLPPPAWAISVQIDPKQVVVGGETEQADGLLKKFDASPRLKDAEFTMPLARTGTGELFRIRANREGGPK